MRGFLGVAPVAGTLLLMGALSLAGTPPFSIFVSELLVIKAGIAGSHFVSVAIFLAMVVIIFAGLVHHVGQMAFGTAEGSVLRGREALSPLLALVLLAAVMLLFGLWIPLRPDRVLQAATEIIVG
jgi:hydrogenase-4 component F